jgi:alpha-mannosidase
MNPDKPWQLHLIANTHWDREWYMSFESLRLRLLRLFDRLLALMKRNEAFHTFLLDGQFSALEDYLELRPEKLEEIRALVTAGRLEIGPWYTQPHETMVGGEALIRNLALGIRECRRFGSELKISYNIDQFGHVSQLPQVLRGFGIESAVGWRGVPFEAPAAFRWIGPDGSAVNFFFSNNGYGEATALPESLEDFTEVCEHTPFQRLGLRNRVEKLLSLRTPNSVGPHLLCLNGIDHAFPQENLLRIIERINRECPGVAARHSSLQEFSEAVLGDVTDRHIALHEHRGELLDGRTEILADVHSARPEVKQANRRVERLLEHWAEPFGTMAWCAGLLPYPKAALAHAWRILLQNQAHDSHACVSAETVYRQVMSRFDQVEDIAREIAHESVLALTNAVDNQAESELTLCVFNPLSHPRDEVVVTDIDIPAALNWKHVAIVADGDVEVPAVIDDLGEGLHTRYDPLRGHPQHVPIHRWRAAFRVEHLPAMGFRRFTLGKAVKPCAAPAGTLRGSAQVIENEFLRVQLQPDGRFDLIDKQNGHTYGKLHLFEDGGEAGFGFYHQPPAEDRVVTSLGQPVEVSICRNNPFEAELQIRRQLLIPEEVTPDRRRRSDRNAPCTIKTSLRLRAGSPRLDIVTTVDNQAGDHRLRVQLPTGIASAYAVAGMPFDDVRRPPNGDTSVLPFQGRVTVTDGKRGLMIASDDIFEYQLSDDSESTLALTLMRATDQLGCGFTNPEHALPTAQCLGKRTFRYSLIPHGPDYASARREALNALVTPMAVVGRDCEDSTLPGYIQPPVLQLKTDCLSGIEIKSQQVVVSMLKRHDERDSIVLRLLNISGQSCETAIRVRLPGFKPNEAWELNLLEERQQPLTINSDGAFIANLAPRALKTIEFCNKIQGEIT